MGLADQIREFVNERYVVPARAAGHAQVTIRTGDVHAALGLQRRMPAVCGALDANVFEDRFCVRLLARTGPKHGANVTLTFVVGCGQNETTREPPSAATSPRDAAPTPIPSSSRAIESGVIYLVACVSEKGAAPAQARDLYVSAWFKKARAYVERRGAAWFILSAEHGLLDPETTIPPYERTLNAMSAATRRAWGHRVVDQMKERLPRAEQIVVFAGQNYREHLMEHLRAVCPDVVVPMEGLAIGEQLRWLGPNQL